MSESIIQSSSEIVIDLLDKKQASVLHVDDERGLLNVAKECLELENPFTVDTALSAEEAKEKLKKKTYDVIVCDYKMPEKDGLEFLKELREDGNNIPFIIFTGKGREEIAIKALNLGADRYLSKIGNPETVYGELAHCIQQIMEKTRTEEKIRESEEHLRAIFEAAVDGIAYVDPSGKIITANKKLVEEILGYPLNETIGKRISELGRMAPEELTKVLEKLTEVVTTGKAIRNFQTTLIRKDGTNVPVEISTGVVKKDGEVEGITTIVRDITERKKMEEELKKREERYRHLTESISHLFFAMDKDLKYTYWNKASEDLTGIQAKDAIGKSLSQIFPETKGSKIERFYLTTIKTQKPQTIINKHTVKNKDYIFEIHAYPTRDGISIYAKDITQKNKAETLYKNVVELSPESILTVDTRGVITSCNTSATKLLGHAKDELVGKHFSKLGVIRVKDLPKYLKLFSEVLRGKITKPIELTFYRKDGRPILCEVRVGLLKENGKIIGIQTVSRDITEQKRIEHRILESQQKFKGLFQDNPEAAVFVDSKFQIMDINPRFKELFGYSLKEVIGKRLLEVIIPEEKQEEGRMLDEKAKKSHVYYDTIRKRKDGTLVSVALSAAPITVEGQTIGYMGLYKEITDQKRVEKELKQSRRHFQTLFNLMVDPVAIVDGKGKILEVTKKAEEITGFKREELVGKNFLRTKIATTKSKAIMMKNLAKRMMGRQMAPYEVDMLTREGKKLPHEINAAKIVYKGKPADMVVFRDVSERKKMREKLRVVGRLTRHDVRNKLSAITGNTYLVRKKLSKDHEVNGFLDEVDSSCRQVERIFDFARNYERLGIEKMSYIDVEKTIREATSLFSDHKGTDISSTCKGLKVLADSLLRQIFYNLIDNSLKYGEKVNQIIISCKRSENDLKLIFDDDGVGIPKAKKEKIFHEGYGEGSGYGLYLIRKICEVYNWTIQETGECGKGAQFTITIPRTNEEEKENYKLS